MPKSRRKRSSAKFAFILLSLFLFLTLFPSPAIAAQLGDVNGDGQINVLDVVMVMKHVLDIDDPLTPAQQELADMNGDGLLNVLDATLVMQKALGFELLYELTIKVWDEDETAIADARVTLNDERKLTGAHGKVTFADLAPATFVYRVEKDNWQTVNGEVELKYRNKEFMVTLIPAEDPPRQLMSAKMIPGITVDYGTNFADILLPETVEVTYKDQTTGQLNVNWDQGDYDKTMPRTYTLEGALEIPAGVVNPDNVVAILKVTVDVVKYHVVGVEMISTITVDHGTSYNDIPFPEEVKATLRDALDLETEKDLLVTWGTGTPGYDGDIARTYSFTGNLVMEAGIANPLDRKARVNVIVLPIPTSDISAVKEQARVEVELCTPFEELNLPNEVEVTLDDASTRMIDVDWSEEEENFQPCKSQLSVLKGALIIPDGVLNPLKIKAEVELKVKHGVISVNLKANPDETLTVYGETSGAVEAEVTVYDADEDEVVSGIVPISSDYEFKTEILTIGKYSAKVVAIDEDGNRSPAKEPPEDQKTVEITNIPPKMISVENVNGNQLIVTFSEPVINSDRPANYLLRNKATGVQINLNDDFYDWFSDYWYYDPAIIVASADKKKVTITLSTSQTDLLGDAFFDNTLADEDYRLFAVQEDMRIIKDLSGNRLPRRSFIDFEGMIGADNSPPEVVGNAVYDLTTGKLKVGFNEPIWIFEDFINQKEVTVVGDNDSVTLSKETAPVTGEKRDTVLVFTLLDDAKKDVDALAGVGDIHLVFGKEAVFDRWDNALVEGTKVDIDVITTYSLSLLANPPEGGWVFAYSPNYWNGYYQENYYQENAEIEIMAYENMGYEFVDWTIDGKTISTDSKFTYIMPDKDTTITGNFELVALAIVEVETLDEITVDYGTPFEEIGLPESVEVVLSDNSTDTIDVDWSAAEDDYDGDTVGIYALEGYLVLSPDLVNPEGLVAQVNVRVVEDILTVVSVAGINDVTVPFGTAYEEIPFDPSDEVEVVLEDDSTSSVSITYDDESEPQYDELEPGAYEFGYVLMSDDHIIPENLATGKITVTVKPLLAKDVNVSVVLLVPGVYNVAITFDDIKNKLPDINKECRLILSVSGKADIILEYTDIQDSFFKPAVQGYTIEEIENAEISASCPLIITAEEMNVVVTQLIPGVFNVSITWDDVIEHFADITVDSTVVLNVAGKDELELRHNAVQNAFFKAAVQGYLENEIKEALVTVRDD